MNFKLLFVFAIFVFAALSTVVSADHSDVGAPSADGELPAVNEREARCKGGKGGKGGKGKKGK